MYSEYAEKQCACDGTWYRKPPRMPKPINRKNNVNSVDNTTILRKQGNTNNFELKLMSSRQRPKGAEWTNFTTCQYAFIFIVELQF